MKLQTTENNSKRSYVIGAANIRAELKTAFPGVKFSVTSQSYSMGNCIDVRWTDGPTEEAVSAIAMKYEKCGFDGTDDSTYTRKENVEWTDKFGGAKTVSCDRNVSKTLLEKAIDACGLRDRFIVVDERGTVQSPFDRELERVVYRTAYAMSA